MKLYTVTMLEHEHALTRGPIAVCTTPDEARDIVEHNRMDIHETNHEFAVIAVISADSPYGLRSVEDDTDADEVWYRWSGGAWEGKYERCEKPASLARVVFGL